MKALLLLLAFALAGCASIPDSNLKNQRAVRSLLDQRSTVGAAVKGKLDNENCVQAASPISNQLLTSDLAVSIAMSCSPRMRTLYANLALSQAEIMDATRVFNPSIDFARLASGSPSDIVNTTWGISVRFVELLLLPGRKKMTEEQRLVAEQQTAQLVLDFERDVRTAYWDSVATMSLLEIQRRSAKAAALSARTSEEFYAAGNISELQLSRERAEAMEAEIDLGLAERKAVDARAKLFTAMGLAFQREAASAISIPGELSLPPVLRDDAVALLNAARLRLDFLAARKRVEMLSKGGALQISTQWLDEASLGFETERETGQQTRSGPRASLSLPLLGVRKSKSLRSSARADAAKAELDQLDIALRNESWSALYGAVQAHSASSELRERLVPLRARITELSQREFNYSFIGAFELLSVKRQEYETYRRYIEAVRDEWLAYLDVQRVAGGMLPETLIVAVTAGEQR